MLQKCTTEGGLFAKSNLKISIWNIKNTNSMREHASSRYIQSSDAFPFSGIKLIFHVLTPNVVICAGCAGCWRGFYLSLFDFSYRRPSWGLLQRRGSSYTYTATHRPGASRDTRGRSRQTLDHNVSMMILLPQQWWFEMQFKCNSMFHWINGHYHALFMHFPHSVGWNFESL